MIPPITLLLWAISGIGLIMVAILYSRILAASQEQKLKIHRSKEAGVADLLVYAAEADDGIVVGKNGCLLASWRYSGDDNASSTDEQRETISHRLNQTLSRLGNGWMIHVDAVRLPTSDIYDDSGYPDRELSHFPDPITAAIEEERRSLFDTSNVMYEGYFVLTLTYLPPLLAQRQFQELMFDDDTTRPDKTQQTRNLIDHFARECVNIESKLSTVFKLTRLKSKKVVTQADKEGNDRTVTYNELLGHLNFCITGKYHPILQPKDPIYLDMVIGGQELWGGVIPKIGRQFIQVVAIDGFPPDSTPGLLTELGELSCKYRWSTRFIFMDAHEAESHLEKFRKKWKQKVRGFLDSIFNTGGPVNHDAAAMVDDAEQALAETNSGLIAQGYYTGVIVLMDEDRQTLENNARYISKVINRLGFEARIETINTMDAYIGSLPGHGVENVRRPILNTNNLADLLPTSTIWTGEKNAPCPLYPAPAPALMHCVTDGGTPFRLNLHVRDLGHTLMLGPTGSGKSTKLAALAAQMLRYKGMTIFAFDKGMSMYPLASAIRATTDGRYGNHYAVGNDDNRLGFCPLQFLETKSDRAWAVEWIDTILALNGVQTSPGQRNEIANAIESMHSSGSNTLSNFSVTIQDNVIREALQQYTISGTMGHLLDAEQDGLAFSDFTVFEIEELMNLGEKYALPVLLYLFRRIERSLKGQPAAILLDEAWIMLGHPVFRAKIREWLKVLRKANCLVLMATQSLSDVANSGILDVIIESTPTKIFLPNPNAREEDASALYRRMGLNKAQIALIADAIPKQNYYYVSEQGRRMYSLGLGRKALAFVGASDKDSIADIKALETQYGNKWPDYWLKSRGLAL